MHLLKKVPVYKERKVDVTHIVQLKSVIKVTQSQIWLRNEKSFGQSLACLPKLFSFPNDNCISKTKSKKV